MASINDLKNQNETLIDLTKPPVQQSSESVVQGVVTSSKGKTVVNMNGMFEAPTGHHSVIEPKVKGQQRAASAVRNNNDGINIDMTSSNRRVVADLSSLPSRTPEEEAYAKDHFIDDPVKNMLEGEESILGKYLDYKEKELTDAYEQVKYNKELKELEDEAETTGDDSAVIDFLNKKADDNQVSSNSTKVVVNDDDILSSLNYEKEEEKVSDQEYTDETYDATDDVADSYDKNIEEGQDYLIGSDDDDEVMPNELFEAAENKEEDYPVEEKTDEEVLNNLNEIKVEKEVIENPDIDLEVTQVNNTGNAIINDIDVSLEEESAPEPVDDSEDIIKKLQALATERLKPVSKRLDISSFTVVKKPISNTAQFNINPVKAAKWVLMNQKATVLMREFTGAELERLREFTQDGNSISSLTKRYRLIYDHIDSPKPASFETWLKSTPFSDEDNYFFAIYIASFKGANYLPRDCSDQTSCKETWLTEDINIMDMVKFESNEAKDKFTKIYQEEDSGTTKSGLYISEIVPLSETVAVAFREPSIYTRIELSSLDTEFREKYASILEFIPYIDSLYLINQAEGTLTPVGYKLFADNNIRTTKSKIQQFAKVLSTLSIDEFGTIRPYINSIATRTNGISYIFPECTCPKCGAKVDEVSTTAEELLFTRYQLGALVNTSLN